jgi:DNA-binding response OmpR family regulator
LRKVRRFAGEVSRMGAVTILAVSPAEEDHLLLSHIFSHSNWSFDRVRTCTEAIEALKRSGVAVVICMAELPDGSWKNLLDRLAAEPVPPRLIVASPLADDSLWADVLDRGGYDVLSMPFEPPEVIRVVSLAWRQWKHESERQGGSVRSTTSD